MPDQHDLLLLLPRTDCGQCGFTGCVPYAEALLDGRATEDACAPGGAFVRQGLLRLLGKDPAPVPLADLLAPLPPPQLACIDEAFCIGCAKCLDACPVDAIVGAPQQLHAVLDGACTGCGLCLPPCPVDCIALLARPVSGWPTPETTPARRLANAEAAPCTGCGDCVPACPEGLNPRALLAALARLDTAEATARRLSACTDCGFCDTVCPSRIPLAATFAHGALLVAAVEESTAAAGRAVTRQAARQRRLARPEVAHDVAVMPDLRALEPGGARHEVAAALARVQRRQATPAREP